MSAFCPWEAESECHAAGLTLTSKRSFTSSAVRPVPISRIDLRTAEAARTPVWHLCRQLAACFPHGVLPHLVRTVLPVLNEVGLRDLGQQPTPCRFKRTARHLKAFRRAARAQAT